MTATIYGIRGSVPHGYSIWGEVDPDGLTSWNVALADHDGVIHEQWPFQSREAAEQFVISRQGRV